MVKLNINWKEVYDKYLEGKSIAELATEYNCFYQTINKNFKVLNYKKRSKSEASKLIVRKTGPESNAWKGGKIIKHGHIYIRINSKYIPEHVYIWEKIHGPVPFGHHIHHIDFNKQNNRIENLKLMTAKDHVTLHNIKRGKDNDKKFKKYYDEN